MTLSDDPPRRRRLHGGALALAAEVGAWEPRARPDGGTAAAEAGLWAAAEGLVKAARDRGDAGAAPAAETLVDALPASALHRQADTPPAVRLLSRRGSSRRACGTARTLSARSKNSSSSSWKRSWRASTGPRGRIKTWRRGGASATVALEVLAEASERALARDRTRRGRRGTRVDVDLGFAARRSPMDRGGAAGQVRAVGRGLGGGAGPHRRRGAPRRRGGLGAGPRAFVECSEWGGRRHLQLATKEGASPGLDVPPHCAKARATDKV